MWHPPQQKGKEKQVKEKRPVYENRPNAPGKQSAEIHQRYLSPTLVTQDKKPLQIQRLEAQHQQQELCYHRRQELEQLALRSSILSLTNHSRGEIDIVGNNIAIIRTMLRHIEFHDFSTIYACLQQVKQAYQLIKDPLSLLQQAGKKKKKLKRKSKHKNKNVKDTSVLTDEHPCFGTLNQVISSIRMTVNHLKSNPALEQRAPYQVILKAMNQLVDHYETVRKKFIVTSPQERSALLNPKVCLFSPGIGFHFLSPTHTKSKMQKFFNDEQLDSNDKAYVNHGIHTVINFDDVHYKKSPDAPGIQYMMDSLNEIITGHDAATTKLILVTTEKKKTPVLASKTIKGIELQKVFEKYPSWIEKINSRNFSERFVMTLLGNPSDEKPDNIILRKKSRLVNIDNDLALTPAILKNRSNASFYPNEHYIHLKSIILFMPQMKHPFDKGFRKVLLSHSPVLIIFRWLKLLLIKNKSYREYISMLDPNELKLLGIPLHFVPGTVIQIFRKLHRIQTLLKKRPDITHQQLFDDIMPLVACYYRHIKNNHPTPLEAIGALYGPPLPPTFEEALRHQWITLDVNALELLKQYNDVYNVEQTFHTQTIEEACCEFVSHLNFNQFEDSLQKYLLTRIESDFPFIKQLTLRNSNVLDDRRLKNLALSLENLTHLNLLNCPNITDVGLSAVLIHHPHVALTLRQVKQYSAQGLWQIAQYTNQLTLIINEIPYLAHPSNAKLIHAALAANLDNIVDFCLYLGIDIHQSNTQGLLPLHVLATRGDVTRIKILLDYGAPKDALSQTGHSALDYAAQYVHEEVVAELLRHEAWALFRNSVSERPHAKKVFILGLTAWRKNQADMALWKGLFQFAWRCSLLNRENFTAMISENIRTLDLSGAYNIQQISIDAFSNAPKLKCLRLERCTGLQKSVFKQLSKQKITRVDLRLKQAIEANLIQLNRLHQLNQIKVGNLKVHITYLSLQGEEINKARLNALINAFTGKKSTSLEYFEFVRMTGASATFKNLLAALGRVQTLKAMTFNNSHIDDHCVKSLVTHFRHHRHLSKICLQINEITQVGATTLATLVRQNRPLKKLQLHNNPIGDQGAIALAKALTDKRCRLKYLDLNQTTLGDHGIEALAHALLSNRYLQSLDIGYNHISDRGATALLQSLYDNKSLTDLRIGGNQINKELHNQIKTIVHRNRVLEKQNMLFKQRQKRKKKKPQSKKHSDFQRNNNPHALLGNRPIQSTKQFETIQQLTVQQPFDIIYLDNEIVFDLHKTEGEILEVDVGYVSLGELASDKEALSLLKSCLENMLKNSFGVTAITLNEDGLNMIKITCSSNEKALAIINLLKPIKGFHWVEEATSTQETTPQIEKDKTRYI